MRVGFCCPGALARAPHRIRGTGGLADGLVRLWALPEFTLQLRIKGRTNASVRMLEVLDEGSIVIGRSDDTIQVVEARARD